MKKILTIAVALLATSLPLSAQNWSLGVHSGGFVFGDFVERKVRPFIGGVPGDTVTMSLSAATRPGLAVDVQHDFSRRWGVRLEGAFANAPLQIKEEGDDALTFDAGELNVVTVMLPVVFRINPEGSFRFHLMGGPAYAMYEFEPETQAGAIAVADRTEHRWGFAAGAGVGWWLNDRWAIEGTITDISTSSPFDRADFPDVPGYSVPRPHNVHTTVGVRFKF
jgi:opacity protein-like surface antigen